MARERWDRILASIDQAARSINGLISQTDRTMKQANQTLAGAERLLTRNEKELDQALEGLVMAVENVNILLEKGASFISRTDESAVQLRRQLSVSAQNLEKATDNLNQFLELLADHPSQLVFGDPPAERTLAPEQN